MPVGDRRRAGGLQLRHLLDLHDADAAGAVDPQTGVVTVIGNLDVRLDGGLKNGFALFDRDLAAVDRQRDGVHKPNNHNADRHPLHNGSPSASNLGIPAPIDLKWSSRRPTSPSKGGPMDALRSRQSFRIAPVMEWLLAAALLVVSHRGRCLRRARGPRHAPAALERTGRPHAVGERSGRCASARRLGSGAAIPRRQGGPRRRQRGRGRDDARTMRPRSAGRRSIEGVCGERLTRFYEYAGARFILVFEPFERNGEVRIAAIYLP